MRIIGVLISLMLCSSVYAKTLTKATWVGGSDQPNQAGVYGTKGVANPANVPGARSRAVSWVDGEGNLWLFGGFTRYTTFVPPDLYHIIAGSFNDLWKFDGENWTWVSGSDEFGASGVYGTKGVASPSNVPGARSDSVSWIDSDGNLWLFGGSGYDSSGESGFLNDLWKFDGTNWTWVSGSEYCDQAGVYGTQGVAGPINTPGGRIGSMSWTDSDGNLWLFGGTRYDVNAITYRHNDLWKFDGSNWTWVSGSDEINQASVYGTKGVADPNNVPGSRYSSASWIDSQDNLWLFGGRGDCGRALWKFDGVNWTWVSGLSTYGYSVYGVKGRPEPANIPGTRSGSATWIDESDDMYLFGGWGWGGADGFLNDLWKYDGENWAWIGGSDVAMRYGEYGTKGVADMNNMPGARASSVSWTDRNGALWLFGGYYRVDVSRPGDPMPDYAYYHYNDLWKFEVWAGDYDIVDFASFSHSWHSESGDPNFFNPVWDLSDPNDGVIDLLDLDAFCGSWLAE